MSAAGRYVGQSVARVEDPRILTGRGRYVADVTLPRTLHACFVRSPYPHARILGLDASEATALEGVHSVVSAREVAAASRPMSVEMPIEGHERPSFHPLATDRVRHVGDPVAIVLASSRHVAEDGAALVLVDYEPLDPVATSEQAADPGSPPLFDEMASNVVYRGASAFGDVEGAFAAAAHVVSGTFRQQRYANVPLETRGGIADFDAAAGSLTYVVSTQNPHNLRFALASLLGLSVHAVRVISGDVGGGFGQKMVVYREDVALCAASRIAGRPVKWIEDRGENLSAAGQARDDTIELEAAVSADGAILGLRGRIVLDQGAYPAVPFPSSAFTAHVRALLPDAYRIPAFAFEEIVVATNKASYVPYRGPWCSAPWAREVLIDRVARALGQTPEEIRLRNLIPVSEQPAAMTTGATLEGAPARETLERLLEVVDLRAFRREQAEARERGVLLGLGLATLIEPAPGPLDFGTATGFPLPPERAHARIEPDGALTLLTSQHPHGQSHETTLAQVAADELGVPMEHVRVVHGDTSTSPFGVLGTSGSRGATRGSGAAIVAVRAVRTRALEIASSMLEVAAGDLEIVDGLIRVKGSPSIGVALAEVAATAYFGAPGLPDPESAGALEEGGTHVEQPGGWSCATHCAIVEVDPGTGLVSIRRYVVIHDCGAIINPAIVDGQIRGGVAQGIGGALLEECVYDEDAMPRATTFVDYLLPTAMDVPAIEIVHLDSAAVADVDFRGVGEGGALGAPPALTNAVADALGVELGTLPLTPTRVLSALGVLDES